jgi:hypothetical protein
MGRVYRGFAIREQIKTTFFGRKKKQRFFSTVSVGAGSFAEAQQKVCEEMNRLHMPVVFIFPYYTKEEE